MTDTSPENVARMLEGVTPGPWEHDPIEGYQFNIYSDDATGSILATTTGFQYAPRKPAEKLANARFIAYAREAVPALAARLAEVEAERDTTRGALMNAGIALHTAKREAKDAEAANAKLREAAEALGAMPEGYCFCSKDRIGDDSKNHEPECAELRTILMEKES